MRKRTIHSLTVARSQMMICKPKNEASIITISRGLPGRFYKLDMADEKSKYLGKGAYGIVAHGVATTKNPRIKQGTQVAIKKQEKYSITL
eukprot:UN24054